MVPSRLFAILLLLGALSSLRAVETIVNGNPTYNTNNNISSTVSGWSSGWGAGNTNTGWDYVGQLRAPNGITASGVYLGNGWVLTAAHVGTNNFVLNGNTYNQSGVIFTNFSYNGTVSDLTLFQISTTSMTGSLLALQSLTIAADSPSPFVTQTVIIGNGGGKSWGANTVTSTNIPVTLTDNGNTYSSMDFVTAYGVTQYGYYINNIFIPVGTVTNNTQLVGGDSGGANFTTNSSGIWQLSGINEAVAANGSSYMVQLSDYSSVIMSDIASVPEPSTYGLLALGLGMVSFSLTRAQRRS